LSARQLVKQLATLRVRDRDQGFFLRPAQALEPAFLMPSSIHVGLSLEVDQPMDIVFFRETRDQSALVMDSIKAGKILSFQAQKVACIKKGKVGKDKEFVRVFQLGRIKGNFLFVLESTSLRMADKHSFIPILKEHAALFGEGTLTSASADKGYWTAKNQRELTRRGVKASGLQRPVNIKSKQGLPSREVQERLRDRRAGIGPMIGHAKHGGQLGRSRMKSDAATLAAGYASVLGLNLRQLIRHQAGKTKRAA